MTLALLLLAVLFLAWSNGANDNFKGVATLYGSATANFHRSLLWASGATGVGALVSVSLAGALARRFSGRGLIPEAFLDASAVTAIGLAGALTVFLATVIGMPTSTTHALSGALAGVGLTAAGLGQVDWAAFGGKFATPLLVSPVLAIGATAAVYPLLRRARQRLGVERQTCLCVGDGGQRLVPLAGGAAAISGAVSPQLVLADGARCVERYQGRFVGIEAQKAVDLAHYLSAGAVCFARAVNDTPKIAALLLAATGLGLPDLGRTGVLLVAVTMTAGGLLQSRRVAETMSRRITDLNPGQGLTANLATAGLVLGASRLGLPVSTTHVSCGTIFGIGLVNRRASGRTILQILLTWVTTLPLGFLLGAGIYLLLAA
ncbi:MAG: anion permease [Thermoanaerobaculia bacterium]